MIALTVGSLFSGVGGFDLGFQRAGLSVRWQCEIDARCRDVLCRNFPDVEVIYSNVSTLPAHQCEPVDVLIGGFPCTDLSIAGKRAGLAGERSGLFYEFVRIARQLRPALVVIENVDGLLNSHGGRDMAIVLGSLRDIGAVDIGWCVLDAQWFGVPQRRKRLFVVADFRGRRASEILSLPEGLRGHPAPGREAGQDITGSLETSIRRDRGDFTMPLVASPLTAGGHPNSNTPGRRKEDEVNLIAYQCQGTNVGEMGTLRAGNGNETGGVPFLAFDWQSGGGVRHNISEHATSALQRSQTPAIAYPLVDAGKRQWSMDSPNFARSSMGIRRFMPVECERLMGWPDDWTRWGASGKEMSDSTRYQMCGNGVVEPVAQWLGGRIAALEAAR